MPMSKEKQRAYSKKYRSLKPEKARTHRNNKGARASQWLRDYKEQNPCKDCCGRFSHFQMEFDHLPGTLKVKCVPRFRSITGMKREIAKCDLVCVMCHAKRTYVRRVYGVN